MPKIILPTQDLFPETLLVTQQQGHVFTDSLKIAEHFGKKHDSVLKVIRNVMAQSPVEMLVNFDEHLITHTYKNGAKHKRPIYRLTRDGFAIVAMSFTGEEAMAWKWKFLAAFNAMESQLRAQEQRYLAALDTIRPNLRPVVDGTQQGQSRLVIGEQIGKTPAAVTYHRRVAKKLGLLVA